MPKAFVNGINMYYEDHGNGFPLVFTHGWTGTTQRWEGQVPVFSNKYRFITYDLRGHGKTDAPADPSEYSLDIVIEDLYQLLGYLQIQEAVFGGHSMGGYITLHFYDKHPDMAAAIILSGTGPGFRTPEKAQAKGGHASGGSWNERPINASKILETQGIRGLMESEYCETNGASPERLAVLMKQNPKGLANITLALEVNPWGVDILPNIKVPTLVICGDNDPLLRATNYMGRKIPGAKKVIVDNAGHSTHIERPAIFNSEVLDFIDSLQLIHSNGLA